MLRVFCCVPSQMLLHVVHGDHLDISQSTGHLIWLHFFLRSSAGHLMPNSFGATMISRASVCQPPHPYGSNSSGQLSSQLTEQSPGTQSVTPSQRSSQAATPCCTSWSMR